jgi:uncharacterized GH25 family protein
MKSVFAAMLLLFSLKAHAQIKISGTIEEKAFRSQQQQQTADYQGSGYWERGPSINVRICIDVLDVARHKISDTSVYTDTDGKFTVSIQAKKNYYLVFHYYCQNTEDYIYEKKVSSGSTIVFKHLFRLKR